MELDIYEEPAGPVSAGRAIIAQSNWCVSMRADVRHVGPVY